MHPILRLLQNDDATSAVEYAVLLALIVAVCLTVVMTLGEASYDALWDVVEALD